MDNILESIINDFGGIVKHYASKNVLKFFVVLKNIPNDRGLFDYQLLCPVIYLIYYGCYTYIHSTHNKIFVRSKVFLKLTWVLGGTLEKMF